MCSELGLFFAYIVGTAFLVKKARASVSGLGSVLFAELCRC